MSWNKQLDKCRGSRPRCVLFMHGEREEVAARLTKLVGLPDVKVSPDDKWMPYGKPVKKEDGSWDKAPAAESRLRKADGLIPSGTQGQLQSWWLAVSRGANTPNWDIASRCRINGKRGSYSRRGEKLTAKNWTQKANRLNRTSLRTARRTTNELAKP